MHVKRAVEIDRKHGVNLKNEKCRFFKSNTCIIHKIKMWFKKYKKYVFSNIYAVETEKNYLQGD